VTSPGPCLDQSKRWHNIAPGPCGAARHRRATRKGAQETFDRRRAHGRHRRAEELGVVHHRFGIGDGYILAVDEWATAEGFEQFFTDPQMLEFAGSIGADGTAPEITITEAIASPDEL
jgi:hypothetical protein